MDSARTIFNPLEHSILFTQPDRLDITSAWIEHIPFGMFIVNLLKPNLLVELGTHSGVSYCCFCQAVGELGLATRCYAVDTWEGDVQAGYYGQEVYQNLRKYHDPKYGSFSTLLQMTFDEATQYFSPGSIDLLHIDGLHTYDAVKHDFENWLPKLSSHAIVLFHDINVREHDYGVWRFWDEVKIKYPSIEFYHGHGLGVLGIGKELPQPIFDLFSLSDEVLQQMRTLFYSAGSRLSLLVEKDHQKEYFLHEISTKESSLLAQLDKVKSREQEFSQQLSEEIAQRDNQIRNFQQLVADKDKEISAILSESEMKKRHEIETLQVARDHDFQIVNSQLNEIIHSNVWAFATQMQRIRLFFIPRGSRREKAFKYVLRKSRSTIHHLRTYGLHSTVSRIHKEFSSQENSTIEAQQTQPLLQSNGDGLTISIDPSADPSLIQTLQKGENLESMVAKRFPLAVPLQGFHTPHTSLRLNLVTDSINSGSLFGGVATSMILATLLTERWNCDLRIITRIEEANKKNFGHILSANGIQFSKNVEFIFASCFNPMSEIPVGDQDVFLTTSWWTTQSVKATFGEKRIIYLLQEDERAFYPYGDDRLKCSDLLKSPGIQFVINTKLLYDHFVSDGFKNIQENGLWFEPSWNNDTFFYEKSEPNYKKNFFFYARPNNLRNLFYLGIEVINQAVLLGILKPEEWELYFVGKDIPSFSINNLFVPHVYQNLPWTEYAALVRKVDLGLSLMYTPHPSYPPLDLAASGAVVVTNRFGMKQNLDQYSKNIICCDLNRDQLVQGVARGIELSNDTTKRIKNYQENRILRDWRASFEHVINQLEPGVDNVSH